MIILKLGICKCKWNNYAGIKHTAYRHYELVKQMMEEPMPTNLVDFEYLGISKYEYQRKAFGLDIFIVPHS